MLVSYFMRAVAAMVDATATENTTANAVIGIENLTLTPLFSQPKRANRETPNTQCIELIRKLIFVVFNVKNVETIVPL